jgi:hypothetical protein
MYAVLEQIALTEFRDVVVGARHLSRRAGTTLKLRLLIRDESFVDVWFSQSSAHYAYHWEQRAQRGCLYRHDNAPDHPHITTHPKHFHNGAEETVEASHIPDVAEDALRYFLDFVRLQLGQLGV